jgi:hypothetical protein
VGAESRANKHAIEGSFRFSNQGPNEGADAASDEDPTDGEADG